MDGVARRRSGQTIFGACAAEESRIAAAEGFMHSGVSCMERSSWQQWVAQEAQRALGARTLACFNANVDVVAHLEPDVVHRLLASVLSECGPLPQGNPEAVAVRSIADFLATLKESLRLGKSTYVVAEDPAVLGWFDRFFPGAKRAIGGQAGIIGNQMAALGAHSVVYTPNLAPVQAELLHEGVRVPVVRDGELSLVPAREAAAPDAVAKVNWIFEYAKGLEFDFAGEVVRTPRANRVIVATRPAGLEMSFGGPVAEQLEALGKHTDVAFVAGYHYATPQGFSAYLGKVTAQLEALRRGHPGLRIHYEYVPAKHREIEAQLLTEICARVDSFGINEHEIVRVLDLFGADAARRAIEDEECAYTLYQGALVLRERLRLSRIQVHNLGYYVMVLAKPYTAAPQIARQAALYGSTVNAAKAKYGGIVTADQVRAMSSWPLSDIGFAQLERFAAHPRVVQDLTPVEPGIWEAADHWVLVVPAHVVPNPVSTVGMGDTISSSTYAREVELAALAPARLG